MSIMPSSAFGLRPVRKPAWPSMDFSIKALHGQTVTQCPHETQLDSPMAAPPSHNTRGCGSSQRMRERLIHLQVLARFDAAPAQNALPRIVAVERVRIVDFVGLRFERIALVLDIQQFRRVVNRAIAVVVVAHRAVELVVPENAVVGLGLGRFGFFAGSRHRHSGRNRGGAGPHELAVDFDDAGIASLNRAELRVIANLRQVQLGPIDHIDQPLPSLGRLLGSIDDDLGHKAPNSQS